MANASSKRPSSQHSAAIIVGAGAVQNAWAPVIRAVQPFYDFPLTADGVNSAFARMVFLLRWFASIDTDYAREHLAKTKEFVRRVKQAICTEINEAQRTGELQVRPEFYNVVDELMARRTRRYMFVNTNWDTVADDALLKHLRPRGGQVNALHIHGSVNDHQSLYLPTEVTRERYRTEDEDQRLGRLHGRIMRALGQARWVVVYGVSLSPLDAELCQTVATGWGNKVLEQIDVVVPDHQNVAHRVNLLLDRQREVKVRGYHPADLAAWTDYTVPLHGAQAYGHALVGPSS